MASYVAGEGEEAEKSFVQVNWLLNDGPFDTETALAVGFLDNLLLGSPRRRSGWRSRSPSLGEAIVGYGLEDELRQPTFAIGLKGVAKEDIPKVESLITETIAKIAEEGFLGGHRLVRQLHRVCHAREQHRSFPRGLSSLLRSLSAWLYEAIPWRFSGSRPLAKLKARMAKEDVFTPLIKKMLIDNTHKVTIELNPDEELGKVQDEEEKAKVAATARVSPPRRSRRLSPTRRSPRGSKRPRIPRGARVRPRARHHRYPQGGEDPSPRTSPPSVPPPCSPTISSPATSSTRTPHGEWIYRNPPQPE